MESTGIIIDIDNGKAIVEVKKKSACGNCNKCSFGEEKDDKIILSVDNNFNANIGDKVVLFSKSRDILKISFYTYFLPVIIFISTLSVLYVLNKNLNLFNEIIITSISLFMMIIYILIFMYFERKSSYKYDIKIVKVL